ncbi:hypothetical protein PaecuDRAFT_4678 [Paenibacillus curdlanolyticus YK9]|uniref:Uncharacterized protein n=1 Tax=Paenibacillus curdlanolyticus YK9 TaxID=717606 RepID=E0IG87_9BACL|nr:hypothetical protein [Paenibacillus curdlanolyticus]EFM08489.1 hypothetical protein PaecuDRAFT_4678 [Paenibacillus curdlanolyticus YK9]
MLSISHSNRIGTVDNDMFTVERQTLFMYQVQFETRGRGKVSLMIVASDETEAIALAQQEMEKHPFYSFYDRLSCNCEKRAVQTGDCWIVESTKYAGHPDHAYVDFGAFI